jgi:protein involved in polysaccharide export with SLBB domain
MLVRFTSSLLLFSSLLGCAPRPYQRTIDVPLPATTTNATLGTGDVFEVRVFQEPDLSGAYRIDPAGSIDFPLVGRVAVAGHLPGEIEDILTKQLTRYVHKPQVSIFVKELNSKRVIVYGQVRNPGMFPFSDPMTISQAISLAGGFTAMAQRERVRIRHREQDHQRITEVNLRAISDGADRNQYLSPGDEVYVPERLF